MRKIARERAPTISFAPDVGRALFSYGWPLNIRELEQCLATCVALSADGHIQVKHLPAHVSHALATRAKCPSPFMSARDDALRLELLAQLARHAGNVAKVARNMGKARMQVHRWCRRFGVDPNAYRR